MTTSPPTLISLPALLAENLDAPFCISAKGLITRRQLLAQAVSVGSKLPEKAYAVNLCRNRYLFSVAYLAASFRNQISLLPPNQSPHTINGLLADYPHSYCLYDTEYMEDAQFNSAQPSIPGRNDFLLSDQTVSSDTGAVPLIDVRRTLSISFTSGSTGKPKAIEKNWREFQISAELAVKQLGLAGCTATFVSTVPTQHMYGLETSLFWPLFSGLSIHDSRPFYPADIRNRLATLNQPGILISTPAHLKACVKTNNAWPEIGMVLSSTAPMSAELARQIETAFNAPLYELFGSTETLSFASRRITQTPHWQCYPGIRLVQRETGFVVGGGHLPAPVMLDDNFLLHGEHVFSVLGRSSDLIKIAGKRASLAELNSILNRIDGIADGVFIRSQNERLSALVVSDLPKKTILNELKQSVDPVFLPRKIYYVPVLPRNATGKIDNTELQDLLHGLSLV